MNSGLGQKIFALRLARAWTQVELAKRSGIGRSYISLLETNNIVKPSADYLVKLARAFNIRPEELYHAAGYITSVRPIFPWQKEKPEEILDRFRIAMPATVPIYEDFPFHAGVPVEPVDYVPVAKERARGRTLEGYLAHGNCLEPEISDGNIIIVDRDGQIDHGDIVACLVNNKLYLGRLRKIADELWLENNEGRIKLKEAQVAAPVIEVRRRLK